MAGYTIVHSTSSLGIGGAETILCSLVRALDSRGYDQAVIYIHDGPKRVQLEAMGITCYQVAGVIHRYDPTIIVRYYRIIKRINPGSIHTVLWAAGVLGRLVGMFLRIPVVVSLHNNCNQNGAIRTCIDRVVPSASAYVAVSDHVAHSAHKTCGIARNALTVIPNGIDAQALQDALNRPAVHYHQIRHACSQATCVIGAVGRLVRVKRFDLLLQSFAVLKKKIPRSYLIIVGSGPEYARLQALARQLAIDHAVSFVTDSRAAEYYSLFDIFVQTSDNEGMSLAVLEAMYCALPVVVTAVDGRHAVVDDGVHGSVVRAGSLEQIVAALFFLAQNYEKRHEMGRSGRSLVVSHYTVQTMAERYHKLFAAVAKRKR